MRFSLLVALLLSSCVVTSHAFAEEAPPPPPLDPIYQGKHRMVLMNSESDLFASFIPQFKKPWNHQLIYLVDAKGPNLFFLVRDADRVSIETESFNLQTLFREGSIETKVNAYLGDINENSTPVYTDIPVNFTKQIYYRELVDLEPSGLRQTYDVVDINRQDRLMIHRIKNAPTFDHIVLAEEAKTCVNQFFASQAVPAENELLMKLLFCGSLKPMYYNPILESKSVF